MGRTATRLGLVATLMALTACVATGVPHHKRMNRGRACQEMRTIYGDMVQMNCGNGRMKMRHMDDEDQPAFFAPARCADDRGRGKGRGHGHGTHQTWCATGD